MSPRGLRWVSVPLAEVGWMGIAVSSWSKVDVGHGQLVVQGGPGSLPARGPRRTWVTASSWSEVDMGSVSPHGLRWVTVPWLRWSRWASLSPHGLRRRWVSVTSWSKVDAGQCHLMA